MTGAVSTAIFAESSSIAPARVVAILEVIFDIGSGHSAALVVW